MYISLSWAPVIGGGADVVDIEAEILAAIASLKFVEFFTPYDGLFLACVAKGETMKQVQLLQNLLLAPGASPGRYSFVITVSANSQPISLSTDMINPAFAKISKYVT